MDIKKFAAAATALVLAFCMSVGECMAAVDKAGSGREPATEQYDTRADATVTSDEGDASTDQAGGQEQEEKMTAPDKVAKPSVKVSGFEKVTVRWKKAEEVDGYEVVRGTSASAVTPVTSVKGNCTEKAFTAKMGKTYHYRVRAFIENASGDRLYGDWSDVRTFSMSESYTPTVKRLSKDGTWLDLRKLAGQKLYGYDIFQGACTDGKYGYYVLYNKKKEKCRIAKMRLSDNKVVKVSRVLEIHHGNDITYNRHTGKLLAVHLSGSDPYRIAVIDPSTLKLERNRTVKLPKKLPGASSATLKKQKGVNGIAYDPDRKQYVLRVRVYGDFIITDKNLKPLRYVKPSVKKIKPRLYQGLEVINGYIGSVEASSDTGTYDRYNILNLYRWNGSYVGRINIKKGNELENIFFANGRGYAGFYHEYYVKGKLKRNNYIYVFDI